MRFPDGALRLSERAMINVYDIAYALAATVSAPLWLLKASARRKVLGALSGRMGRIAARSGDAPAILIHAVSLGEVNATRGLVDRLRAVRGDLQIIISTTTETGFARASELYGAAAGTSVIRYPLDFSRAVTRLLDALRPSVVVLLELEVWPNFLLHCSRRGIPVMVANGRMTSGSFRRYRLALPFARRMFARLSSVCVQDETYAMRFAALGVAEDRIRVAGTMKFDTATVASRVEGDEQLAADLGLALPGRAAAEPRRWTWVCGSTGPGEEKSLLQVYRQLRHEYPQLRLAIIPRKPERFDEVAGLIASAGFGLIRRSQNRSAQSPGAGADVRGAPPVILGDTMGELRKFYSLADVVFVGRTLVDLGSRQHGSDMIEPAALAKPVIVGPYTGNFAEAMSQFRAAAAVVEVNSLQQLLAAMRNLLRDPGAAGAMGRRAQQVVVRGKGATERHVQIIAEHLPARL